MRPLATPRSLSTTRLLRVAAAAGLAVTLAAGRASSAQAQGHASPSAPGGELLGSRVESDVERAAGAVGGGGNLEFLSKVLGFLHQSNSTAIQGGQLAQQKGSSSVVKQLAGKVVSDHAALEKEVAALARARGIALPGGTPSADAGGGSQERRAPQPGATASGPSTGPQGGGAVGLSALQGLKGPAFDRAFLGWLGGEQQRDAQEAGNLQSDAKQSGDPVASALLAKVVPTLESHAQSAQAASQASAPAQRQGRKAASSAP